MQTIFDKTTRDELIKRIHLLNVNNSAQWGKMNIYQMLKHCTLWEEMALGKTKYKQTLLGKLFGRMALPDFIGDDKPFKKNVPTVPKLKIKETSGDILSLQNKWIKLIEEYNSFDNDNFIHPFFGKMSKEQIGLLAYKHTDHHLRQFNR